MAKKEKFFWISSFHSDFRDVRDALEEATSHFKYLEMDYSETQTPDKKTLFEDIKERIRASAFVIADVSLDPNRKEKSQNPNVMFEAGYALGIGKEVFFIARQTSNIPSDILHYRIHNYSQKPEDKSLSSHFKPYLREIMEELGVDTEEQILERNRDSEQLRWLNSLVQKLYERVKQHYIDESKLWEIFRSKFQISKFTFSLIHKYSEQDKIEKGENGKFSGILVEIGVFYSDWNRKESPFRIMVYRTSTVGDSRYLYQSAKNPSTLPGRYNIVLNESINTISEEKILSLFEDKLDELLEEHTPNISRKASLAKRLETLETVMIHLRFGEVKMPEGYELLTKRFAFGLEGAELNFRLISDDSTLKLRVNFLKWEKSEEGLPYWVSFIPSNPQPQMELEKAIKIYKERISKDGSWSLFKDETSPPHEVTKEFYNLALSIIKFYKPLEKSQEESENEVEIASEENKQSSSLEPSNCQIKENVDNVEFEHLG